MFRYVVPSIGMGPRARTACLKQIALHIHWNHDLFYPLTDLDELGSTCRGVRLQFAAFSPRASIAASSSSPMRSDRWRRRVTSTPTSRSLPSGWELVQEVPRIVGVGTLLTNAKVTTDLLELAAPA
jgi:hypothetical protein